MVLSQLGKVEKEKKKNSPNKSKPSELFVQLLFLACEMSCVFVPAL